MLSEVMEHYGLALPFDSAGFFETEHHQKVIKQMKAAIQAGRLVALSGLVGAGKTILVHRLQEELAREGKVLVARSLSVDKERVTLQTLMMALFFDLSPEEDPWIPSQGERRERELRHLIRKGRKPAALFVDEAHDLHPKTLRGLKRLSEVVKDAGARLAIVLIGHPKLQNDLRRPTMEEIGHRTTIVSFRGIAGQQRPYIDWLLKQCVAEGVVAGDIITDAAVELLAHRLGTPLQIEQYLTRAFEEGWRIGEKPVTAELVEALLSPQLDDLEPRLRRHGYDIPDLAELINARQSEIRSLLRGELEAERSREITAKPHGCGPAPLSPDNGSATAHPGLIQGEHAGFDCEHVSANVSPVSDNVSARPAPVSPNVSQKGRSIASTAADNCEPLQVP